MDLDYEIARRLQEEFEQEFSPPSVTHLSDSLIARQLQTQFEQEICSEKSHRSEGLSDSLLAKSLQEQFQQELAVEQQPAGDLVYDKKKNGKLDTTKCLVDPSWEIIDPTPDVHVLFMTFNKKFFWGKLDSVCVSWSKKMKMCAGVCSYQGRGGMCHITLSEPLLKLRPRKDLVETLLHEMIHALLFVTHNNKDRDGHGPEFHKHMYRINAEAGTNITVYHDFHDEVELYRQHWWRCDGPCIKWKPYFGIVRRSVNRAPGPCDKWWGAHSRNCGGTFHKIKSPESKVEVSKKGKENKPVNDIRKYVPKEIPKINQIGQTTSNPTTKKSITQSNSSSASVPSNIRTISTPNSGLSTSVTIQSKTNNIHGFSNFGNKTCAGSATKNSSNTIVINKKPSSTVTSQTKSITPTKENTSKNDISSKTDEPIDLHLVRNHWINKFNNHTSVSASTSTFSGKRKPLENMQTTSKVPKLSDICSQDSLDCESVMCPVCNNSYGIDELNSHLDLCLNDSKKSKKECIICTKKITISEYETHVNDCVKSNFDDVDTDNDNSVLLNEEDTMDVIENIKCRVCENDVPIDCLNEHMKVCQNRNKCPECKESIDPKNFDIHLADCLIKKFDEIEQRFTSSEKKEIVQPQRNTEKKEIVQPQSNKEKKKIVQPQSNKEKKEIVQPQSNRENKTVDCLACGKKVLKSNLNSHLEECLTEVFDEEKEDELITGEDEDGMYNCPFCMKLFSEIQMNKHIDLCLKTVDNDKDAELNKDLFLREME